MRTSSFGALALVLLLAVPGLAQDPRSPSVRELAYARLLAERLGEAPVDPTRVLHTSRSGIEARGLTVELPGLTVARLRFDSPAEAQAFAAELGGQGVVEVRGKQLVILRGPRAGEAAALATAWEVLPAPAQSGIVRQLDAAPDAGAEPQPVPIAPADAPAPVAAAAVPVAGAVADAHGISELLRHHLMDEELRPLRGGQQRARTPRELVEAAAAAVPDATMGAHQRGRVVPAYDALTADERARFDGLLERFRDQPAVRDQLLKALAASSSVDDIAWLGDQLDGRSPEWIAANTRLTGDEGVKQQFHDSCAPTAASVALRGEYDPVYSLRTRQDDTDIHRPDDADPTRVNPNMAAEQRALLEGPYAGTLSANTGGSAVPRDQQWGGQGQWVDEFANDLQSVTGLRYTYQGTPDAPIAPDAAVSAMQQHLQEGRVVPFVVNGGGVGGGSHAVLATSVRTDAAGEPSFLVFDPWEGRSSWVTATQMQTGTMNVAGWSSVYYIMAPEAVK